MASFADALPFLLSHEGGFVDDPTDRGGATKYGITQSALDSFRLQNPDLDMPRSVADLTEDEAVVIYHADYWMFDDFDSQKVATKVLDLAANMGLRRGIKILQEAVGAAGGPELVFDGLLGPKTVQAVNACDEAKLLYELCELAAERYKQIAVNDPSQLKFLKGWLSRAESVPA